MTDATVIPIIPLGASADGKRNAFYHPCKVFEAKMSFASCHDKITRRKEGRLPLIFSDCSVAIGNGRCPALDMVQEEKELGRSIYFLERIRFTGLEVLADKAREFFAQRVTKKAAVAADKAARTAPAAPAVGEDYMAAALTKAAVDDKVAAPKPTPGKIAPRAGESVLEAAKRLMAESKAKAA